MLLIELPSFPRASLNGMIGVGAQMEQLEEEIEVESPLEIREDEVFLFIQN